MTTLQTRILEELKTLRHQPHITLTYAQSLDGSISSLNGNPVILSGKEAMTFTHQLRAVHDGILVGIGTIVSDNPSLTVRLTTGQNPTPIIIDTNLNCPLDSKILKIHKKIILVSSPIAENTPLAVRRDILTDLGVQIIECNLIEGQLDLQEAFRGLRMEGIQSIMVEGGASIISTCISTLPHLIDRVILTIAPLWGGGKSAITKELWTGKRGNVQVEKIGEDILVLLS